MKRIRIVSGIRKIEDSDVNSALFKVRDVLMEHRSVLITRIVSDLGTYIDYKFGMRISQRQQEMVKEHLYNIKNATVDLDRYSDIVDHFFNHELTYIGSEPFMKEIDEGISVIINAPQLKLVN
jgi:hypothetical protein